MQEIWTRDDLKHLKSLQSKLINKSILLPSQSVLPNLIQFYFYHCFWALLYVTKADYIYIDHPPPLLQRPFVRKMKKHCRQSYLTISDSNDNENNRKFEPTLGKSTATTDYFFSSIFTQPNSRGWQHRIANFCFVLSWCTVEAAAAIMHKTDQKNGGPGWCKVFSLEPDLFNFFFEVFSMILY